MIAPLENGKNGSNNGGAGGATTPALPTLHRGQREAAAQFCAWLNQLSVRPVPLSDEVFAAMSDTVADLLRPENKIRMRAAGARLAAALAKYNLELAAFVDKSARLDGDAPTERIEHRAYAATFDRLG